MDLDTISSLSVKTDYVLSHSHRAININDWVMGGVGTLRNLLAIAQVYFLRTGLHISGLLIQKRIKMLVEFVLVL